MASMSEGPAKHCWFRFSIVTTLCLIVIASGLSWFATVDAARYAAELDSYGHQRMSRWQAETIHRGALTNMPDSEFRETDSPSEALPQRGRPFPTTYR